MMDQRKRSSQPRAESLSLCALARGRRALLATFIGIVSGIAFLIGFYLVMGVEVFAEPIMIVVFSLILLVAVLPLGSNWIKLGKGLKRQRSDHGRKEQRDFN